MALAQQRLGERAGLVVWIAGDVLKRHAVWPEGHVIVTSFGPEGPNHCSGLEVTRYSAEAMHAELGAGFRLLNSLREDHRTPAGAHSRSSTA